MKKPLPTEFKCPCGGVHKYSSYVFAHWHDLLVFECKCGKSYDLLSGEATERKKRKKK